MKVILNGFGLMNDKRFVKAIKDMTELEWRLNEDVVSLIEKKRTEIDYLLNQKLKGKITKSQQNKLNKLTDDYNSKCWLHFKIQDVDVSRKWCIVDYDTSKHIQYLDVVDEVTNFYGFI